MTQSANPPENRCSDRRKSAKFDRRVTISEYHWAACTYARCPLDSKAPAMTFICSNATLPSLSFKANLRSDMHEYTRNHHGPDTHKFYRRATIYVLEFVRERIARPNSRHSPCSSSIEFTASSFPSGNCRYTERPFFVSFVPHVTVSV